MAEIVIGVDESRGAAAALRWAHREAGLRNWTLKAVLAWGLLNQHHDLPDEWFDPDYDETDAAAALDVAVERALGSEAAGQVARQVVNDLPARALLGASERSELLVVGARGLGGLRRQLLGSVSEQCLHHAACPVAVVHATRGGDRPEAAGGPPERVLVGIDRSEESRRALHWAADAARARGGVLEVIHAWQPPFLGGYPYAPPPLDVSAFEEAARRLLDTSVERLDVAGLAQPVELTAVCGGAAGAILDAAKAADLVVVGSRGAGGFRGLLLGSVGLQVAHHAPCPTVVVRHGQ